MKKLVTIILLISALLGLAACTTVQPEQPTATAAQPSATAVSATAVPTIAVPTATPTTAPPPTTTSVTPDANINPKAPPAGLIYRAPHDGIYQIQASGQHLQLLDEQTANTPQLIIAPDGRHAAYLTINENDNQLWLIDTAAGDQRRLAAEHNLAGFLMWASNQTLFVGVWLDPNEAAGPNNGHIATLDIANDTLQIMDEAYLSGNRPALLSNDGRVAFDVFSPPPKGRTYYPDSGVQIFDPTMFSRSRNSLEGGVFNPAWAPNGDKIAWLISTGDRVALQVFDLEAKTAVQLHDWDPARFGGLVPSPIWNPDGDWLTIHILANGPEGSGIWLLAADGSEQIYVDAQGRDPHWVNDSQLVYNAATTVQLYDTVSGDSFALDIPKNSAVLAVTNLVSP